MWAQAAKAQCDTCRRGRGGRMTMMRSPQVLPVVLICCWILGAGEGIRTLDPNLGKVVLYP
jgi:hypothetical protein